MDAGGAAGASAVTGTGGGAPTGAVRLDKLMSPEAAQANARCLYFCRIFISIVGGCAAGVMGLHGLAGLAFYALTVLAVTAAYLLVVGRAGGRFSSSSSPLLFFVCRYFG